MNIPFSAEYISNQVYHFFSLSCCRDIFHILEGYEFLFYKGPMHAEELYAKPRMRQSGDIYIIVQPKDLYLVLQRLGNAGYPCNGSADLCTNHQNVPPDLILCHRHAKELMNSIDRQMSVEVHISPFKISNRIPSSLHEETFKTLLARRRTVDIRGELYPMLGRTDELLALVHHFAMRATQLMTVFNCSFSHSDRLPLHYLEEIEIYIRHFKNEIDTTIAKALISSHGMTEEFRFAERLLQKLYNLSFPFSIPESRFSDGWERIYAGLNGLDIEELLSPEFNPQMERFLFERAAQPVYSAADDEHMA